MSQAVPNGAAPPPLPPLYRTLEALNIDSHASLTLRDWHYGYAAGASALPIAAEEFGVAARSLPIVFAATPPHMPVVLLGLAVGHNAQVDAQGRWRAGVYVPAFARRYPFFLLRTAPGSDEMALCIDPTAPHFSGGDDARPLFLPDGETAPALQRALDFCRAVEEAMLRTRRMALGLAEMGLLRPSTVQFRQDDRPLTVQGFHAVDRPALDALSPDALADLRDKGWLEAIYAHLLSIGGVPDLARDLRD